MAPSDLEIGAATTGQEALQDISTMTFPETINLFMSEPAVDVSPKVATRETGPAMGFDLTDFNELTQLVGNIDGEQYSTLSRTGSTSFINKEGDEVTKSSVLYSNDKTQGKLETNYMEINGGIAIRHKIIQKGPNLTETLEVIMCSNDAGLKPVLKITKTGDELTGDVIPDLANIDKVKQYLAFINAKIAEAKKKERYTGFQTAIELRRALAEHIIKS